jgi:replication factor A1
VTRKSDLKNWNNSRGSGQVMDVILQDASGEIKVVGFNEAAVKMHEVLQENKVYFISKVKKPHSFQGNYRMENKILFLLGFCTPQ